MAEIPKKRKAEDERPHPPKKGPSEGGGQRASGVPTSKGGSRQGNIGHEGNISSDKTHR